MSLQVLRLLRIFIDRVVFRFRSDRALFRFLIDKILFRVLSDRVFFESSVIRSSSGSAVINSLLGHQCSFSAMSLVFYQIPQLFFLSKQIFCFTFIILSKTISLTCSNCNKTDSGKHEKILS